VEPTACQGGVNDKAFYGHKYLHSPLCGIFMAVKVNKSIKSVKHSHKWGVRSNFFVKNLALLFVIA